MSISRRSVVQLTFVLLAVGFLALMGIVGMTFWLGERAQVYFDQAIEARDMRGRGGRGAQCAADGGSRRSAASCSPATKSTSRRTVPQKSKRSGS